MLSEGNKRKIQASASGKRQVSSSGAASASDIIFSQLMKSICKPTICTPAFRLPQWAAEVKKLQIRLHVQWLSHPAQFCAQVCDLMRSVQFPDNQEGMLKELMNFADSEWHYIIRGALWRIGMTDVQFKELCRIGETMPRSTAALKIGLKSVEPGKDRREPYRKALDRIMPTPESFIPGYLIHAEKQGQNVRVPAIYLVDKDANLLTKLRMRKREILGLLPSQHCYGE